MNNNILKQKISPALAFILILLVGYLSIFLMIKVFEQYANDELVAKNNKAEAAQQ